MSLCRVPLCLVLVSSLESVCVVVYWCVCLNVAEGERCCDCVCVRTVCVSPKQGPRACVVCDQLSFIAIPCQSECHLVTVYVFCLCGCVSNSNMELIDNVPLQTPKCLYINEQFTVIGSKWKLDDTLYFCVYAVTVFCGGL